MADLEAAFAAEVALVMREQIAAAMGPVLERMARLEGRLESLPNARDGKDADPALVRAEVERAVALMPKAVDGLRGEKGERGEKGDPGARGEAGERGLPGERGDQGPRGEQGPKGEKGDPGQAGKDGTPGEKGERGEQGIRGEKGDPGARGEQGERGLQGEPGVRGEKGDVGERGPSGERGEMGLRGEKGDKGDAGERGEPGLRGERGLQGEKGDRGEPGARGEKGERGERGQDGASLTAEDIRPILNAEIARAELELERRASDVLQRAIASIPRPKDGEPGKDGIGLDSLQASLEDEGRAIVFSFKGTDGGVREQRVYPSLPTYRGVWKACEARRGEFYTYGGSIWNVVIDTKDAPAAGHPAWRLAVKGTR